MMNMMNSLNFLFLLICIISCSNNAQAGIISTLRHCASFLSFSGSSSDASSCKLPINANYVRRWMWRDLTSYEVEELQTVDVVHYLPLSLSKTARLENAQADHDLKLDFPTLAENDQIKFRYQIVKHVMKGSFGLVVKAKDFANDGQFVALKFNNRNTNNMNNESEEQILKDISDGESDSVIQLLDAFDYRGWRVWSFPFYDQDWFGVMDNQYSKDPPAIVPITLVRKFSEHLLDALSYLKSKDIVHLDIKPENVLMRLVEDDDSKEERLETVLTDFGFSKYMDDITGQEQQGTLSFMAPEVFFKLAPVGFAADMWSLGASLFTLVTMEYIVDNEISAYSNNIFSRVPKGESQEINGHILKQDKWDNSPISGTYLDDLKDRKSKYIRYKENGKSPNWFQRRHNGGQYNQMVDFISRLLVWDPSRRMTVEEAKEHPFMKQD